jgi:hypothetical protein
MINNKVTGLPTSLKLVPIMGGVETEKVWGRHAIIDERDPCSTKHVKIKWSSWMLYDVAYNKDILIHLETVPAYSFLDMLARVPDEIEVCDDDEGWTEECFLHIEKTTCCYDGRTLKPYLPSVFCAREEGSITEALAKLILWLGENGYIKEVEK